MTGYRLIAIGAGAACVALYGAYLLGAYNERTEASIKLNENIVKAIRQREGINEKIDNMGAVALCLELGGVPDQCEQLRGLEPDRP